MAHTLVNNQKGKKTKLHSTWCMLMKVNKNRRVLGKADYRQYYLRKSQITLRSRWLLSPSHPETDAPSANWWSISVTPLGQWASSCSMNRSAGLDPVCRPITMPHCLLTFHYKDWQEARFMTLIYTPRPANAVTPKYTQRTLTNVVLHFPHKDKHAIGKCPTWSMWEHSWEVSREFTASKCWWMLKRLKSSRLFVWPVRSPAASSDLQRKLPKYSQFSRVDIFPFTYVLSSGGRHPPPPKNCVFFLCWQLQCGTDVMLNTTLAAINFPHG